MLIGFSGACGSGKTTLVNAVAEKLGEKYKVAVVSEVARKVFKEFEERFGVVSLTDLRSRGLYFSYQMRILIDQIAAENTAREEADIVLCDRTVYDVLMYTLLWCGPREVTAVRNVIKKANRYDMIFLCELLDGVELDDGFRTPDIDYRETQEWLLKRLLPDYIYLPAYSLEERVEFVRKRIERVYLWRRTV